MRIHWSATLVLVFALTPAIAAAKGGASHAGGSTTNAGQGGHQQVQPFLRGNNGNDRKGGRYLAAPVKNPALKRTATPEKVEAGSENVRRVK